MKKGRKFINLLLISLILQFLGVGYALADQSSLKAGKILGAQFLVTGAVTEFETKVSGTGGGVISFHGIAIGGKKYESVVGLDLRIFDVNTSEILAAENVTEKIVSTKLTIAGYYKGIGFGTSEFNKTPIGEATRKAIEKAVKVICDKLEKVPWQGRVSLVKSGRVYINVGSKGGVSPGDEFVVYRKGEEIIDPDTGESLGFEEEKIGKIRVTTTREKFSVAKVVEGQQPQRGDVIRVESKGEESKLKEPKKRVAVASFENKVPHVWWNESSWKIGKGIQDMLITALVKSGKFIVLEREELEKAIREQSISQRESGGGSAVSTISQAGGLIVVRQRGGEILFEDFSSYGMGQTPPFGRWKVKGGSYHIEQAVQPDGKIGNVLKGDGGRIFINGNWKNYILEVNTKDGEACVYFRLSGDGSRGYYVHHGLGGSPPIDLYKFVGNTKQKIAQSKGINLVGWWYLRIEVKGPSIKVFANGQKVIDIIDNDPSLSSGGIGIGSCYGGVYFDNVRVASIK